MSVSRIIVNLVISERYTSHVYSANGVRVKIKHTGYYT